MKKQKMEKRKNKYTGLGFVELIISIGVAGITLMVLLTMASNSMREAIRYERHDALTRLAIDGALVVRRHVEQANNPRIDVTFEGDEGYCYEIDFGENAEDSRIKLLFSDTKFAYNPPIENNLDELAEEDYLYTKIIYGKENELGDIYYLAYCIENIDQNIYVGKVITGYVECSNCGIQPYIHSIIVNVREIVK